MARGVPREWPTDEELLADADRYGSINASAEARGIADKTYRNRLIAQGLLEGFKARCAMKHKPVADDGVSREEKLEQENRELRGALTRARSEDVKFERVIDSIERHLPTAAPSRPKGPPPPTNGKRDGHTLVLLWSDQHVAEIVSLEETGGMNEYNWEIMLRRHDELRRGIASWAEVFAPIDELVIAALGDGLSGNIHEELAETNELPFSEAIVQWGVDGAQWIASLPDVIPWRKKPRVRVAGVVGNHPRAHKKPRAKHRHDNGDWVSYQVMRQALSRQDWVTFEIPKGGRHLLEVCGRRVLMMHGDQVPPTSMVGVPWGGVIRLDARMRNQYAKQEKPYDHLAIGHFHEANLIGNRRIWVNGSVKGADEYGLDRYGDVAAPTQLLVPFHPRRGMVGGQYIDLEAA